MTPSWSLDARHRHRPTPTSWQKLSLAAPGVHDAAVVVVAAAWGCLVCMTGQGWVPGVPRVRGRTVSSAGWPASFQHRVTVEQGDGDVAGTCELYICFWPPASTGVGLGMWGQGLCIQY